MSKKKIVLTIVAMIGLIMTGCSSGLQTFAETDIPNALNGRIEANLETAEEFKTMGAISEEQYKRIEEHMLKQKEKYLKMETTDSTGQVTNKCLDTLSGAVSRYALGGYGSPSYITYSDNGQPVKLSWYNNAVDANGAPTIDVSGASSGYSATGVSVLDSTRITRGSSSNEYVLPYFVVSNYVHAHYLDGGKGTNLEGLEFTGIYNVEDSKVDPIELIDNNTKDTLNELVSAELYVLRPNILSATKEATLDGAIEKIKQAIESKDKNGLSEYFQPVVDSSGNPVTLIDTSDEEYNLVGVSKRNTLGIDKPGYDLRMYQYDKEVIHVRLQEFNSDAIAKLNEVINTTTGSVRLIKNDDGSNKDMSSWKAFIVEYPIQMIDKMKNNGNNVDVTFKQSGVGVNICTGQFIKYEKVNNKWDTTKGTAITANDYYLTLNAAQNNDAEGISSLVLKGYDTISVKDSKGNNHELVSGRLVFRDYLEATFAPEFVDGENLVAFGRKIRFKMDDGYWKEGSQYKNTSYKQMTLRYPKGENIAYFVDKDGNKNAQSTNLQITDFCSYKPLTKKKYKNCSVTRLSKKSETTSETKKTYKSGSVPKQSELKQKVLGDDGKSISPTLLFPGNYIGKIDYTNDSPSLQRFPCITTTKGLFDSALFSDWINLESSTASLSWWQTYLSSNGYSYEITNEAVNEYLNSNYKYELSQNGIIILDLEVVAKIQEQYDEESALQKTSNIRTMFMVLGWFIIAYAMILMLAWVFDTNSDFGVKLLGKLTFGNWVAIMYEDDMPYNNANEQTFLTAGKLFLRCIIIIVIGIVLIRVNIFNVIYVLIDIFGGAASEIEKVISGFK